jgi:hypothetical protein
VYAKRAPPCTCLIRLLSNSGQTNSVHTVLLPDRLGCDMRREHARYDLFKKMADGPIWAGCENNLKEAKVKIADLSRSDGMEYFVFDSVTQTVVASVKPSTSSAE